MQESWGSKSDIAIIHRVLDSKNSKRFHDLFALVSVPENLVDTFYYSIGIKNVESALGKDTKDKVLPTQKTIANGRIWMRAELILIL